MDRRPKALSGGQRQRVAVGRAIVRKPEAFLFDEPLSNLDAKMRVQMRTEISKLHTRLETTMIYVTHDQVEAMTMGDRIVVMKDGLIQQVAEPTDLYDNPANTFVAGFIGTPPMNFFSGSLIRKDGNLLFEEGSFSLAIPLEWQEKAGHYLDRKVIFGARPENIGSPTAEATPGLPKIRANLEVIEPMGAETYLYLNTGRHPFIARVDSHRRCHVGDDLDLAMSLGKAHIFDPETSCCIV
jgi:multiple sugar transport system ATP-binding protein